MLVDGCALQFHNQSTCCRCGETRPYSRSRWLTDAGSFTTRSMPGPQSGHPPSDQIVEDTFLTRAEPVLGNARSSKLATRTQDLNNASQIRTRMRLWRTSATSLTFDVVLMEPLVLLRVDRAARRPSTQRQSPQLNPVALQTHACYDPEVATRIVRSMPASSTGCSCGPGKYQTASTIRFHSNPGSSISFPPRTSKSVARS